MDTIKRGLGRGVLGMDVLVVREFTDTFDGVVISPNSVGVYKTGLKLSDFQDMSGDYIISGGRWYSSIDADKIYMSLRGRVRENYSSILVFKQAGNKWGYVGFIELDASRLQGKELEIKEITVGVNNV